MKEVTLIMIANRGGHVAEDKIKEVRGFDGRESYVVPLTEGIVNVFNIDRLKAEIDTTIDEAIRAVEEYETAGIRIRPYLLLSGSIVISVLAAQSIKDKLKELNILIWDTKRKVYVPREGL